MKHYFPALDGIRGLAAFYVVVHHARLALTVPYHIGLSAHPDEYNQIDKAMVYFFGLFKFGQEAIIIFFVLSGFVIHLKQTKKPVYEKLNVPLFFKHRILRIYPTLIFAIILCVVLDYSLILVNQEHFHSLMLKYTTLNFLTNFFLVPDSNAWGNNFPIWSLKHEWFFYLAYPLLFWIARFKKILPLLIACCLFISFLLSFRIIYIGNAASTLLIWMLGAVLAEIYIKKKNLTLPIIIFTSLLIVIYPFIPYSQPYPIKDLTFGLITCGIFYFIINDKLKFINTLLKKFSKLGIWSFSLYLLHMPLINTYQNLITFVTKREQPPFHLWHVLIASIIIPPIIYVFFYYTERITILYKEKVRT